MVLSFILTSMMASLEWHFLTFLPNLPNRSIQITRDSIKGLERNLPRGIPCMSFQLIMAYYLCFVMFNVAQGLQSAHGEDPSNADQKSPLDSFVMQDHALITTHSREFQLNLDDRDLTFRVTPRDCPNGNYLLLFSKASYEPRWRITKTCIT